MSLQALLRGVRLAPEFQPQTQSRARQRVGVGQWLAADTLDSDMNLAAQSISALTQIGSLTGEDFFLLKLLFLSTIIGLLVISAVLFLLSGTL